MHAAFRAGLVLLVLVSGCRDPRSRLEGANVVLVVADALRADHLGCYGYERETTPFIDSLAASGVLFEDVTSAASQTVPAMVSLWSGVYPHKHGVQYFPSTNSFHAPQPGLRPLVPGSIPMLAEYFRLAGYRTGAVITNPWLRPRYGFDRGYGKFHYLEARKERVEGKAILKYPRADAVNALAGRLLRQWGHEPFLLYLHYMDVHAPYEPPAERAAAFRAGISGEYVYKNGPAPEVSADDIEFTRATYDAEIRAFDDALRGLVEILQERDLLESTLLVVTADHGEEFHEHGGLGHGWTLYEEVLRTPLLFSHPALEPRRILEPVSAVDLLPTLLDLVGQSQGGRFDGISLAPLIFGEPAPTATSDRLLFSELGDARAVRKGNRKVLQHDARRAPEETFDLALDPEEARSLGRDPTWRATLVGALERLPDPESGPPSAAPAPDTPEERSFEEQLRALGYVD